MIKIFYRFILCLTSFIALTGYSSTSFAKVFSNPLFIYRLDYTICMLPLKKAESSTLIEDIRPRLINLLLSDDKFNYHILFIPDAYASQTYNHGFSKKKNGEILNVLPNTTYWKKYDIDFLLFGAYKSDGEKIIIEVSFYDIESSSWLFGKQYQLKTNEIETVQNRLAVSILEDIHKNRPSISVK